MVDDMKDDTFGVFEHPFHLPFREVQQRMETFRNSARNNRGMPASRHLQPRDFEATYWYQYVSICINMYQYSIANPSIIPVGFPCGFWGGTGKSRWTWPRGETLL